MVIDFQSINVSKLMTNNTAAITATATAAVLTESKKELNKVDFRIRGINGFNIKTKRNESKNILIIQ